MYKVVIKYGVPSFPCTINTIECVFASDIVACLQSSSRIVHFFSEEFLSAVLILVIIMILLSARKLNSWFKMMTVNEVSLNRLKLFPIFCVIFSFFKSKFFHIGREILRNTTSYDLDVMSFGFSSFSPRIIRDDIFLFGGISFNVQISVI